MRPLVSLDMLIPPQNRTGGMPNEPVRTPRPNRKNNRSNRVGNECTINGVTMRQVDWADKIGISQSTFHARWKKYSKGLLSLERLLALPMSRRSAAQQKRPRG